MNCTVAATLLLISLVAQTSEAGDLVRGVRSKISAGDLASGVAAVEDYRKTTGVDAEYLDAIGWLARGAEMFRKTDLARQYVAELRREIPNETPELLVPRGAAIEVEARLLAASEGRGVAIRFLEDELARAKAPAIESSLASLRGKPVLLFFWAEWCGDCKAQSASLSRAWQKYRDRGLEMIAVTRLYENTPSDEKARVEKVWKESYAALDAVPVVISTSAMERYGASATPTFALVDRKGIVRLYTPTRLSEAELSRKIEEVLSEAP